MGQVERWKQIRLDRISWDYEVSTCGRVRNISGHILSPWKRGQRKGTYLCIRLCLAGRERKIDVHRLVALMFIPNPHHKPEVHHRDGNPFNNNVENLAWTTRSENEAFKYFMDAHLTLDDDEEIAG